MFTFLQGNNAVSYAADFIIFQDAVYGRHYDCFFNPFLLDGFLLAVLCSFCSGALVIIVLISGVACATFADHHPLAHSAEKFCGEQMIRICFCHCRSSFILFKSFLHPIEQIFRNNGGDIAGYHNILILKFSDIFFVLQNAIETVH